MKLLIIRSGALGDTLLLMPLINALKGHQVIILGRKPGIDYLEPYVKQCIDIERGGWHRLFIRDSNIDITRPQVDQVAAFVNDEEGVVSANLCHMFAGSKINVFSPLPGPDSKIHIVLYMAYALQSAGIPVNPQAIVDAALKKPVMRLNKGAGKKIVLNPGSGSKKKNYSIDFWFDLANRIRRNCGPSANLCFLTGPAEEELIPLIERNAKECNAETALCPVGDALISILNKTFLYIGHDSGVTHLAAMLGINTIALFKNSPVSQWRPLGPLVRIIAEDGGEEDALKVTAVEAFSFINRIIE